MTHLLSARSRDGRRQPGSARSMVSMVSIGGLLLLAGGVFVFAPMPFAATPPPLRAIAAAPAPLRAAPARPVEFEPNRGQAAPSARYIARAEGFTAEILDDGVRIAHEAKPSRRSAVASVRFVGIGPAGAIAAREPGAGVSNYLLGADSTKWLQGVPRYRQLRQPELYPGVDLVYYGRDGALEYDLVVRPGADASPIRFAVQSSAQPVIEANGDLLLDGAGGALRMHRPVLYQHIDGERKTLSGDYVLLAANEVGFRLPAYDHAHPLVIDPTFKLLYSTYVGGVHDDQVGAMALDAQNNAYVIGNSGSEDWPVSGNAYQTGRKALGRYVRNVVVTKFDASGTLVYSTFLGGTTNDYGYAIAVDASGRAVVAGATNSSDFPVTAGAFQSTFAGPQSAWLATLSADGSRLVRSSYYAGSGGATIGSVAIDAAGVVVVGGSAGPGLPTTTGTYKPTLATGSAAFVARFDPAATGTAQLLAASYYGTDAPQPNATATGSTGYTMALDAAGSPWLTGQAFTANLPVTSNAVMAAPAAMTASCSSGSAPLNSFAYVAHLSADLRSLLYASYLTGRTGGPAACSEYGRGIAFDAGGNVYVGGSTSSLAFPTTAGALQATSPANGGFDGYAGFIAKLKADGTSMLWSTYFGGSAGRTFMGGLVADAAGSLWVYAASGGGANFPISTDALQRTHGGGAFDATVSKLDAGTGSLVYSTFLGGAGDDAAAALAIDVAGNAYVAGTTASANFPVTATTAFQPTLTANAFDGADWFFSVLGTGTVGKVTPSSSGNAGDATLTVSGAGFQAGATAVLVAVDSSTIPAADFVLDEGGTGATLTFPLDGRAAGAYALRIDNPDGTSFVRSNAFTVTAGGVPVLSAQVLGRPKIRVGVASTYSIVVANTGTQDAYLVPLWIALPDGLAPALSGQSAAETAKSSKSEAGTTYVSAMLPRVPAGESLAIPMVLTAAVDIDRFAVTATLQAPWFATREGMRSALVGDGAATYVPDCVVDAAHPYTANCYGTYLQYAIAGERPLARVATAGDARGVSAVFQKARDLRLTAPDPCKALDHAEQEKNRGLRDGEADLKAFPWGKNYTPPDIRTDPIGFTGYWGGYAAGVVGGVGTAAGNAHKISAWKARATKPQNAPAVRLFAAEDCEVPPRPVPPPPPPLLPQGSASGGAGGAADPNDKVGPDGDGSASHYIRADAPLAYQIQFENVATASLPAANVVVTDQLDPAKVDLASVTLGAISFGSTTIAVPPGLTSYQTTVALGTDLAVRVQGSLDSSTGVLKWTFTTLDAATHLPPSDPTLGFLPPDTDGRKGQGAVTFNVRQKAGAADGTVYANLASIVFDANAPIVTPTWTNTVDSRLPQSKVQSIAPLPGTTSFDVAWSGTDAGAGVRAYTVFVSVDGAAYAAWQTSVATTTARYTGASGHSYAFHVVASDGAGNAEAPKSTAEASIAVTGAFPDPTVASNEGSGGGGGCTIGVSGTGADATLPLLVLLAAGGLALLRRRRGRRRGRCL